MFGISAYGIAALNSATLQDSIHIVDNVFSDRNNHMILTEQYECPAMFASSATITAAQLDSPTVDAFNPFQIFPTNKLLAVAANPNIMDLRKQPVPLPMNEELKIQLSNSAGGAEQAFALMYLRAIGAGAAQFPIQPATLQSPRFWALFTATITFTVNTWSPFANIAFTNALRGGAYQCNGVQLIAASGTAFQINFVKFPMYAGRKLYPGDLCVAVYGNQPQWRMPDWLGGYGRFNNFELPQIRVLANASVGSATYTGYMDLTYLGPTGADALP
jgi:hypothetical protein